MTSFSSDALVVSHIRALDYACAMMGVVPCQLIMAHFRKLSSAQQKEILLDQDKLKHFFADTPHQEGAQEQQ